jgi:carboxypeptidase C (cathepsin A)
VDYTLDHMGLKPENHKNVIRGHYDAGHMVYIDNASMAKLKQDVDALFDRTAPK